MPLNPAMWVMTLAEMALWATLSFVFWKKQLQHRFPAMGRYLALRVISTPLLMIALFIQSQPDAKRWYYAVYFAGYWGVYIASSVLLLFISMEVFRSAVAGFSGLLRFGTVVFRWAAVASILINLSAISAEHADIFHGGVSTYFILVPKFAYQLMRSVSIIELCLLAFLCLSMNALRLSTRDLGLGIALGFGVLSSSDFVLSAFDSITGTFTDPVQFVGEGIILLALGIWLTYSLLPEPARQPVVVAANSTIYRWNEIASALGHKGTNIAVQQPANSFFLTDVEKVVEKVLTRTLHESETKS